MFETDPVCKMKVMPGTAAGKYEYRGKTYYFCAPHCLNRFKANPEQFLAPRKSETRNPKSEVPYTCPMHPDVHQIGPGSCPFCGMALEQETVSLDDERNPELDDMGRRFRAAVSLTIPVLVIAMSETNVVS